MFSNNGAKWKDLKCLLEKRSELSPETFDASPETLDFLQNSLRILVLGE